MIRKTKINDIYELVNLEKMVFEQSLGESFLYDELMLNPFAHYFVLETDNQIIGYIGFRAIDDQAEMMNFAINPNKQKQGNGSKLLNYSIEYLQNLGVKKISLEVRVSNENAIKLYEKNGFIKSHTRKNYYEKEDAYVYIKEV
jgi:[ribosomal protein S18]-alanine N-acetyltransferase